MSLNKLNLTQLTKWVLCLGVFVIIAMIVFVAYHLLPQKGGLPSDVASRHYHHLEEHNNNYYVLREFNTDDVDDYFGGLWQQSNSYRELWKYDKRTFEGEKIFKATSVDFRVSLDENYAAIQHSHTGLGTDFLVILNLKEKNKKIFEVGMATLNERYKLHKNEGDLGVGLIGWSDSRKLLWFSVNTGPGPGIDHLFSFDISNNKLTHYDVTILKIFGEYDFNRGLETLVYSDYPATYDFDSTLENLIDQKRVNLYLYDLDTEAKKRLASSRAGPLNPKWIDNDTIEYTEYPFEFTEELSQLLKQFEECRKRQYNLAEEDEEKMVEIFNETIGRIYGEKMVEIYDNWAKNAQRKRIKI